jgi:hypothetical protein
MSNESKRVIAFVAPVVTLLLVGLAQGVEL